jgi:hypothetical protein
MDGVGKFIEDLNTTFSNIISFTEIENDDEERKKEAEELDEDEETQPFEIYDRQFFTQSIPEIERDHEDILMIQHSYNAQNNIAEARENRHSQECSQHEGKLTISIFY